MRLLHSVCISFSMYSKIPMPAVPWNQQSMRYVLCFFPIIGFFVALAQWGWFLLSEWLGFSAFLLGAGVAVLPIVVTGGIHIDGLLDTFDALASHQSKERKLEILKDSHVGAFAVIGFGVYLVCYLAIASNLVFENQLFLLLAGGHFLGRCLSGLAIAYFPCAKDSGLVYTFADSAAKKTVRVVLVLCALGSAAGMIALYPLSMVSVGAAVVVWFYYYGMSKRQFGGITGDLAGYFLQLCELAFLAGLLLSQRMEALG